MPRRERAVLWAASRVTSRIGGRVCRYLRLSGQQDLLGESQPGLPPLRVARVVEPGVGDDVGDRRGAAVALQHPRVEPGVAVERDLPAGEVVDEPVQQGHERVLGEEGDQAVGDDHGRPSRWARRRASRAR